MLMPRMRWCSLGLIICLMLFPQLCRAGAVLKPNGADAMPVFTRSVDVKADITGQFAATTMVMIFQNESENDIEADFIYALPSGAVATYFAYWAGEERVEAKIVEKKQAAAIYRHLTSYQRDPALIEFTGKSTFRVRISPVPANQDLKVEIRYVESLASDGDSIRYSVPIGPAVSEQSDPLESVHAIVRIKDDGRISSVSNNYGLPSIQEPGTRTISIDGRNYRPTKDLAVRILREHKPLRAELHAEPGSGTFSLALTPDQSLRNPKVRVTGVPVSMMTPARLPDVKAGRALVVSGVYKGSGDASVTLSGQGSSGRKSYTIPIRFTPAHLKGIAPKLWASLRMADLGSKRASRKSVVALSFKHGLPSRYTSWLAVPKAETRQLGFEKIEPKLRALAEEMLPLIADGKMDSPEYRTIKAEYDELTKPFDAEQATQIMVDRLWDAMYACMEDIAKLRFNNGDSAKEASLRSRVERMSHDIIRLRPDYQIGNIDEDISWREQSLVANRCGQLAQKLVEFTMKGNLNTDEAKDMEAQYHTMRKRLAPDSPWASEDMYEQKVKGEIWSHASKLVEENHRSKPDKKAVAGHRALIDRLAAAIKISPEAEIQAGERQWAQSRSWHEAAAYAGAIANGDSRQAKTHLEAFNKLSHTAQSLDSGRHLASVMKNHFSMLVYEYRDAKDDRNARSSKSKGLRQRILRLEKATGESMEEYLGVLDSGRVANRAYEAAAKLTSELGREHPFFSRVERLNKDSKATAAELKRTYAKHHAMDEINAFNAAADQSISAWLEEQKIRAQAQTGASDQEKLAQAAKIRKEKQETLETSLEHIRGSIRGGDPLISVEAPRDALKVIAILPDGNIKDLAWNEATGRWEARFDVPTGTPDGDYVVKIIIMMADGTRRYSSVSFKVDNAPPTGIVNAVISETDRNLLRLEVIPNEVLARAAALLPWGERIELRQSGDGVYRSSVRIPASAAPGKVEIIMTDNAHNRGTIYANPGWR